MKKNELSAVVKFIKHLYPKVEHVEIESNQNRIPSVKVIYFQEDPRIQNDESVFAYHLRENLRHYLSLNAVPKVQFRWEDYGKPDFYLEVKSLNKE